jgi:membrane protein
LADDLMGLGAEMSYQFLFALFPFFVFLAAMAGFVGELVGHGNLFSLVMNFIALLAPAEIQNTVRDWVFGVVYTRSLGLLTFGVAGALLGATAGTGTLAKGLNRAHRVAKNRPFWMGMVLTIIVTMAMAGVMLIGVAVYTVGEWTSEQAVARIGLDDHVIAIWSFLHGPGVAVGLFAVLLAMYALLPNAPVRLRQAAPGALFATAAWLIVTKSFSFYLQHFGRFDVTYGSIATAIMLIVWLYAVSLILMAGGEINALLAGHRN